VEVNVNCSLFEQIESKSFERRTMMKKLLVLALVMGIASLATAGFDLSTINGLSYSVDGNKLTITGADVVGYTMNLAPEGGSLSNGVVAAGFIGTANAGSEYYGVWTGVAASVGGGGNPNVTGTIFTIDFTPGTSLVTFAYSSAAGASTITMGTETITLDGYSMTIVPEPMTMGLLGLGGLFLARRKKA
jgi:hypothetical protein